jgi:hypothetical protein
MGKSKAPKMQPVTTQVPAAGQSYADFITQYAEKAPQRAVVERSDAALERELAALEAQSDIGLSQQYAPQWQALGQKMDTQQRQQDVADLAAFTPQLRQALGGEAGARMYDTLGRQLEQELAMGSQLDAQTRREIEQSVRAAQSARGLTRGTGAVAAEATVKGTRAQALKQSRQQAAMQFLNTSGTFGTNPFAVMTRSQSPQQATASAQAPGFAGFSQMAMPGMQGNMQAAQANIANQWNVNQANYANKMFAYQNKSNQVRAWDPTNGAVSGLFGY